MLTTSLRCCWPLRHQHSKSDIDAKPPTSRCHPHHDVTNITVADLKIVLKVKVKPGQKMYIGVTNLLMKDEVNSILR